MGNRLKLLYIGTFSGYWVSDNYRLNGFKSIFNTMSYDYRTENSIDDKLVDIIKIVDKFKPDIVFINKGERLSELTIIRIKNLFTNVKIFLFNGDQRGFAQKDVIRIGRHCDAILINNNDEQQWKEYYDNGIKKIYEYHTATDIDTYRLIENKEIYYDIIFIGGHYGNTFPLSKFRFDCIRKLSENYKVAVAGGKQWRFLTKVDYLGIAYGEAFSSAISKSRITLGINAFNDVNNYTSNRTWNSLACGKPYLCHYFKGYQSIFKHMKHLIIFKTIDDCVDKAGDILKNYDRYKKIGIEGMKYVANEHTYKNRSMQLVDIYKDICNG